MQFKKRLLNISDSLYIWFLKQNQLFFLPSFLLLKAALAHKIYILASSCGHTCSDVTRKRTEGLLISFFVMVIRSFSHGFHWCKHACPIPAKLTICTMGDSGSVVALALGVTLIEGANTRQGIWGAKHAIMQLILKWMTQYASLYCLISWNAPIRRSDRTLTNGKTKLVVSKVKET